MAVEPVGMQVTVDGNRPVWVVNTHNEPYTEVYRGKAITVPPNGEKSLILPYLKARKFLGQPKAPADKFPNGQWRSQPKALATIEMTDDERANHEGKDISKIQKEIADKEKAMSLKCSLCEFVSKDTRGLKTHMTRMHEGSEPIPEE